MEQAVQVIGVENLPGFKPEMLDGVTCSNAIEKEIWGMLSKFIDFPADNLPTYCATILHSLYNYKFSNIVLHLKGQLNVERFPCRKTCGFCGGKFLSSN